MRTTGIGISIVRHCLALMIIVLFACSAFGQSATDGAIGGVVTDESGAVIPNAGITTHNLGTGAASSSTTDGVGRYLITHLQPGTYSMELSANGF